MTQDKAIATRRVTDYLPMPISKSQAAYLLHTIWPGAPEVDVIKAAILCQQYGLNPLMRQVYLIKFDKWEDKKKVGEEWVTVLGIKATRQIAQQSLKQSGIRYSYADGPRIMTEEEQVKIRGKVDNDKIWAITILKDSAGSVYPGYGFWPIAKVAYGADKGNDGFNMAFLRSERNALDKLAPGALPDIETADDSYIVADYRVALAEGEKQFSQQVERDIRELWPSKSEGEERTEPTDELKPTPPSAEAKSTPPVEVSGSPASITEMPAEEKDTTRDANTDRLVTKEEISNIYVLLADNKMGLQELGKWMREIPRQWKTKKLEELTLNQYSEILKAFEKRVREHLEINGLK